MAEDDRGRIVDLEGEPDDSALRRAQATLLAAQEDPLALASMNATLRAAVNGYEKVVWALLVRVVGTEAARRGASIVVTETELRQPDDVDMRATARSDGGVEIRSKRRVNLGLRRRRR